VTALVQAPARAASGGKRPPGALAGQAAQALRRQFPARQVPGTWPVTAASRAEISAMLSQPPWQTARAATGEARRRGAGKLLRWLESFPGQTWQQRWSASPMHALGAGWHAGPAAWLAGRGIAACPAELQSGLLGLLCADVVRPDLGWLSGFPVSGNWRLAVAAHRDPGGFARLEATADPAAWSSRLGCHARTQVALLLIAKGGGVSDITVGDCLELREAEARTRSQQGRGRTLFYAWLHQAGTFPPGAPVTLRFVSRMSGQVSVARLVDRYELACQPVRDLIVDYLAERQPALDYNSLEQASRNLALHFWRNLEASHPGIGSLHLPAGAAAAWKERVRVKVTARRLPDGTLAEVTSPRISVIGLLSAVRGFYLDIAQWATEDPARWGPWAAPCPVTEADVSSRKFATRRKARMDQRTRERLPVLPALVRAAEKQLSDARLRLEALRAAPAGGSFTVTGTTFIRPAGQARAIDGGAHAYDAAGHRTDLARAEHRAFWAWAAVEFLRHTGCRIEEMLEASHHSITQYTPPGSGEIIPLLQIAPSKTDTERLLVVSPELADVLSAIVSRVRDRTGAIPLVSSYDPGERLWNPPMPLLFQWQAGGQNRAVSSTTISKALTELVHASGLTDDAGQPLRYQPHDFRRVFATEAILNGMPPRIAQLILGHRDINTTMGYKAVYPEEAINGHRAFIARRRALRPAEEYRTPTDSEWEEFLGHFERRRVALGDCGRAWGTSCQHEHSCVRCPLLRPDPAQRPRLEQIRGNLADRIAEAEREGWTGEAEGLRVSLAAADAKLAQLDDRARRATTISLGIPAFRDIAGRTAAAPPRATPDQGQAGVAP
jgi:hypothetical protein